jgi:hypothetical protein
MKKETNEPDRLKGKNPFTVPEGYMEGLASRIMSGIPEKTYVEPAKVTLMDRIRPWVYMAAVFAGLGLFLNLLVGKKEAGNTAADSIFVQTTGSLQTLATVQAEEDDDYLEYLETQYANYILVEELSNYE